MKKIFQAMIAGLVLVASVSSVQAFELDTLVDMSSGNSRAARFCDPLMEDVDLVAGASAYFPRCTLISSIVAKNESRRLSIYSPDALVHANT